MALAESNKVRLHTMIESKPTEHCPPSCAIFRGTLTPGAGGPRVNNETITIALSDSMFNLVYESPECIIGAEGDSNNEHRL